MIEIKNLFNKGWQSDSEPSLQPPNTVRDILNMRMVSERNNTYALESLKGTLLSFSLNPNYFPIGWVRFGDNIAIFSTKDIGGADQNGEIGIATIDPATLLGTYVPHYNHVGLTFNASHQIESRAYIENDFIGRVYWTDKYNAFRTINLNDSTLTTYFAAGALSVGTVYMVVKGKVTNATTDYGPNEVGGTAFTADGTEAYTGTTLVIAYVDITTLDVVPQRDQGNITFNSWLAGGNLLSGGYQYCYQLFTNSGVETNFSYLSMPFHVGNTVTPDATFPTLNYQAFQGGDITLDSLKGQRIQIDNIDTDFDGIRVVAVRDTSDIATDPPVIFFSGPITGSTMTFDNMGGVNLGTLSAADLAALVLAIKKIGTLAILKNRMFIGNVEFAPFIRFDRTGVTATPIKYAMPSDVTGRPDQTAGDSSAIGLNGHGISAASIAPVTGLIYKDQWYRVGGTGSILYNAGVIAAGSTFQGTNSAIAFTINAGAPTVTAIIHLRKYGTTYRDIDINDDWLDTKGAAVATHLRSLPRGETVRWGILFYDNFHNPIYVQWMLDQQMPQQYDNARGWNLLDETANYYGAGLHHTSLQNLGTRFSGLNFNAVAAYLGVTLADLLKYIGGFSIVRAPIDRQILGQGILAPTAADGANTTRPTSSTELAFDFYGTAGNRRQNIYTFYSPEFLFQKYGLPNTAEGDKLTVVDYLVDSHVGVASLGTLESNNFHYYEKFYDAGTALAGVPVGSQNTVNRLASANIAVGASGIQYNQQDNTKLFENRSETAGALAAAPLRFCTGSWTFLISTVDSEVTVYPNGFAAVGTSRSLVNYIRPKGNLYGGTGESALAATQYVFAGHYQPMDAAFVSYLQGNAGIADNIDVFGGDTYISIMDLGRMISDQTAAGAGTLEISFGIFFPVESRINVALRQGRHLSKDRTYDQLSNPGINQNGLNYSGPTLVEEFVYNIAYSYTEQQLLYPALPVNFVPTTKFSRRVYVSPVKTDGEIVDNFRIFPVNDFIDLEGADGALTNLLSKSGGLYYLQERSAGNLPVNQQTTIPTTLGQPISIGTGGVLQRYDTIQDFYGNQHQFGIAEFEGGWGWFDAWRKTWVTMTIAGSTANLSASKGLRGFFGEITGTTLINDNPVRGNGISAAYNAKYGEMLLCFRGVDLPDPFIKNLKQDFTVSFDAFDQQYQGKYSMCPGIMIEVNNLLFVSYTKAYSAIAGTTGYLVGDMATEGTTNYVCWTAYTSAGVPVAASADAAHWKKTVAINEVHIADIGQVCKFFGKVDNAMMQVSLVGDGGQNSVFDNVEMQSDQQFFDTAEYDNSHQTAAENVVGNDEYKYLNRSEYWSVPFASNDDDRFRDHYLLMTLTKDNRLNGDPTVSKGERLKIVSMTHVVRKAM